MTLKYISSRPTCGKSDERLVGRFMIKGGQFSILEDHNGLLEDSLPEGPMDERHNKILFGLIHSGYYKIVSADHINQGHHDDLVDELSLGNTEPDQEFIVSGPTLHEPMRLEFYGENAIVDGEKLDDDKVKDLMDKIHSGVYRMVPI